MTAGQIGAACCRIKGGKEAILGAHMGIGDRKSTRLNSSHLGISYAVYCLKKKNANADSGNYRLVTGCAVCSDGACASAHKQSLDRKPCTRASHQTALVLASATVTARRRAT